jgi:hypothetical protein
MIDFSSVSVRSPLFVNLKDLDWSLVVLISYLYFSVSELSNFDPAVSTQHQKRKPQYNSNLSWSDDNLKAFKSYLEDDFKMVTGNPAVEEYGWTAVPRKIDVLLKQSEAEGPPPVMKVEDILVPDTPLAKKVQEYAKEELPVGTYHHSMRVFYYGMFNLSFLG